MATIECTGENSATISLLWKTFNNALSKESRDGSYLFNPCGWITDMAGAYMEGIETVFGTLAVDHIKTCQFHFKNCRNRQTRKLDKDATEEFKRLCNALIEAQSQGGLCSNLEKTTGFPSVVVLMVR